MFNLLRYRSNHESLKMAIKNPRHKNNFEQVSELEPLPPVTDKLSLPQYFCGELIDLTILKNKPEIKIKDIIISRDWLMLDFDKLECDQDEAFTKIQSTLGDLTYIAYTSFSSTRNKPKIHLLIKLKTPIKTQQDFSSYKKGCKYIAEELGWELDTNCLNEHFLLNYPCKSNSDFTFIANKGDDLEEDAFHDTELLPAKREQISYTDDEIDKVKQLPILPQSFEQLKSTYKELCSKNPNNYHSTAAFFLDSLYTLGIVSREVAERWIDECNPKVSGGVRAKRKSKLTNQAKQLHNGVIRIIAPDIFVAKEKKIKDEEMPLGWRINEFAIKKGWKVWNEKEKEWRPRIPNKAKELYTVLTELNKHTFRYDTFTQSIEIDGVLYPESWEMQMQEIASEYSLYFNDAAVNGLRKLILEAAQKNKFCSCHDIIIDEWNGEEILLDRISKYFDVELNEEQKLLHSMFWNHLMFWLLDAGKTPHQKIPEQMFIFNGKKGDGKTSYLQAIGAVLANKMGLSNTYSSVGKNDLKKELELYPLARNCVIMNDDECIYTNSQRGSFESSEVKEFISQKELKVRLRFGQSITSTRNFIFTATTDSEAVFKLLGNNQRRYVVLKTKDVDAANTHNSYRYEDLLQDLPQMIAEAYHKYKKVGLIIPTLENGMIQVMNKVNDESIKESIDDSIIVEFLDTLKDKISDSNREGREFSLPSLVSLFIEKHGREYSKNELVDKLKRNPIFRSRIKIEKKTTPIKVHGLKRVQVTEQDPINGEYRTDKIIVTTEKVSARYTFVLLSGGDLSPQNGGENNTKAQQDEERLAMLEEQHTQLAREINMLRMKLRPITRPLVASDASWQSGNSLPTVGEDEDKRMPTWMTVDDI